MKDFFKVEDFKNVINHNLTLSKDPAGMYASIANVIAVTNEKLNKLIESSPVVYGSKFISNDRSAFDIGSVWNITKLSDKTHSARLMFIEEIKKESKKLWVCFTKSGEMYTYTSRENAEFEMKSSDVILEFTETTSGAR